MRNHQASKTLALLGVVSLLLTLGCKHLPRCPVPPTASDKGPKLDPNDKSNYAKYVLEVNNDGLLLDLRPKGRRRPIGNGSALTNYLNDTIFQGFRERPQKKMLLFVHGGLLDRDQAMAHFKQDYREILDSDYYPVFVIWPSGWKSTYFEHLFWVRQGIKAETTGEKTFSLLTSPFVLLADLGRAIMRLPLVIANNSQSDIESETAARNREGGAAVQQYQDLARTNFQVVIGDDYSLKSDRTLRAITYWPTLPIKYVLASFIDGLGKGAWDDMLRRTQQTYPARLDNSVVQWTRSLDRTNEPAAATAARTTQRSLSKRQAKLARHYEAAGLPLFIEVLRQYQTNNPALEVTLVGHSMGTIILNRVVRDADMNFANIVYMGAACSVEDFSTSVLPYMKQHTNAQFYNLCLHPVAEAGEWQASMLDLPPRGSLLVWIDNFLQNPVTEQERTFGRWRNLFRSGATGEPVIHRFYDNDPRGDLKERLHFQAFSVGHGNEHQLRAIKYQWNEHPEPKTKEERCDTPLSHGEFTEMPYWDPKFWWRPHEVAGSKANQVATAP